MIPTKSISIRFLDTKKLPGFRDSFLCTSSSISSLLPIQVLAAGISSVQHSSRASLQLKIQFAGGCMHWCFHTIQFRSSFNELCRCKISRIFSFILLSEVGLNQSPGQKKKKQKTKGIKCAWSPSAK